MEAVGRFFLINSVGKFPGNHKQECKSVASCPVTAVDMVVPKSFPALCTPYVQVVHQPWKCTVHKSWKCLHRWSVQEVSKSCKKCFVSKSVSKSVLHNSCIITVSKKCPSWALSKLGPNLTHAHGYLVRLRFRLF